VSDPGPDGPSATVVVYSRPGCHLCEEAIEAIAALHGEGREFELHEIDIESDDLLFRRMLEKIPVVEVDGVVVSELTLDEPALRARLDTVLRADDRGDDRGG
jgi:glutaredoxin